jgi:7,8-dihydropterin-6-yl-methyl-4-(beta-D-ribofuranosyl)aminobenzene 5'-phosphate synthase
MKSSIEYLKITTLVENYVQTGTELGQWGLSFYIELTDANGEERNILFDTGINKDAFFHNVKSLKKDLSKLDCIVLSHGHYDHTSAIVEAVKASGGIPVYAHPYCFYQKIYQNKKGKRINIGIPDGQDISDIEAAGGTVVLSKDPVEIVPGFWTTGEVPRRSFEKWRVTPGTKRIQIRDGKEYDDLLLDDLSLWCNVEGFGPYVVTGCAHAGIVNTLLHVKELIGSKEIYGFTGGTHIYDKNEIDLERTLDELATFGLKLMSPCHCTGFQATAKIWQRFPDEFVLNYSGKIIEIPEKKH